MIPYPASHFYYYYLFSVFHCLKFLSLARKTPSNEPQLWEPGFDLLLQSLSQHFYKVVAHTGNIAGKSKYCPFSEKKKKKEKKSIIGWECRSLLRQNFRKFSVKETSLERNDYCWSATFKNVVYGWLTICTTISNLFKSTVSCNGGLYVIASYNWRIGRVILKHQILAAFTDILLANYMVTIVTKTFIKKVNLRKRKKIHVAMKKVPIYRHDN